MRGPQVADLQDVLQLFRAGLPANEDTLDCDNLQTIKRVWKREIEFYITA